MTTSPAFDLARFKRAQDRDGSYPRALGELRAGRKSSHWIWWVFPQLRGLGSSQTTAMYALAGRAEACAYLADDLLRSRLVEANEVVCAQLSAPTPPRIEALMGSSVDTLKLVSSATLFHEIAGDAAVQGLAGAPRLKASTAAILESARAAGYPACQTTLESLRAP